MPKKKHYKDYTKITFEVTLTYKGKEKPTRNEFETWFTSRHANWLKSGYTHKIIEKEPVKVEIDPPKVYKRTNTNSTLRDLIISACEEVGYTKSTHKKMKVADEKDKLFHVVGDYAIAKWNQGKVAFIIYTHYGLKGYGYYNNHNDFLRQEIWINPETGDIDSTYKYYAITNRYTRTGVKTHTLKGNIADPDIKTKIAEYLEKVLPIAYQVRVEKRDKYKY